jgi:ADP-heptose:LPS heptosyltransferase
MHPDKIQKLLDRYFGILLVCSLGLSRTSVPKIDHLKRILFIQISAIGDVILLTPTLRAIREQFPHAHLTMVTSPINQQLLQHCPYIDETLTFRPDIHRDAKSLVAFVRSLREKRFDLAIDFEHWPRLTALLAYLSGAPRRIGFRAAGQYRHYVFTDTVEHVRGKHELLSFLEIARLLVRIAPHLSVASRSSRRIGTHFASLTEPPLLSPQTCLRATHRQGGEATFGLRGKAIYLRPELEVWPCAEDFNWVEQFLKEHGIKNNVPLIGIHPDAGRTEPRRRWTKEGYQQVADDLAQKYGAQIVLTGAPSEVELSKQIASIMQAKAVIAAGKTNINQLAALFSRCQFVLCGNCGPMHLATAVKTPVVALHGPTNPAQWGPWGEEHTIICSDMPCSPCLNLGFEYDYKALPDGTSRCMRTISVETVLSACERQLTVSQRRQ